MALTISGDSPNIASATITTLTSPTIDSGTASTAPLFKANGTEIGQLAKAWVAFAGSSGTIRSSFNVSSVTKGGTGVYTVNITNAMPDANYSAVASTQTSGGNGTWLGMNNSSLSVQTTPTTTAFTFCTANGAGTLIDQGILNVAVFR